MTYPPRSQPHGGPPPTYPPSPWQQPVPYPPPPPRRRTGLIVTVLAVVVLALGTLAITGFVAPGFFLGDDDGSSGDTVDPGQLEQAGGDPQALTDAIVAALRAKDAAALDRLFCADATEDARSIKQILPMVQQAQLDGEVNQTSDTEASARVTMTANGTTATITQQYVNAGGTWCWRGVAVDEADMPQQSPEEKASIAAAKKVGQEFLDALNDGSKAKALRTFCEKPPSVVGRMIDAAIDAGADVRISEIPTGGGKFVAVLVEGTIGGKPAKGTVMTEGDELGGERCVSNYLLN